MIAGPTVEAAAVPATLDRATGAALRLSSRLPGAAP
jgi:hypothetical protein